MTKLPKIVAANAGILILYAGGLGISFWLGMTPDEFIKIIPTVSASAMANMTTLTFALIATLKGTAKFEFGSPEQDNWSVILPLSINCQGASGIRLERIDAGQMEVGELFEGANRNVSGLPLEVKAGQITELHVRFNVVKGDQNEICKMRKIKVSCIYFIEGTQSRCEISKSIPNVFSHK